MMTGLGRTRVARLMALVALTATSVTGAQTVPDQAPPETGGLDIPANLQIFGRLDPNVRKPTAVVNDTVITATDVDQRLALIAISNNVPLASISTQERDQLRLQVLRQLIDETLQIQEAKTADINITPAEIDQAFASTAPRSFRSTAAALPAALTAAGSSVRSLRREIEAELAWSRYLRRRISPFVNVGDQEVQGILDRLKAAQGTQEFNIREIFLRTTPANEQQVFANGRQIVQGLSKGEQPFDYYARTFSDASTKAQGGDLGWVRAAVLPPEMAQAVSEMQVGQVAGPVQIAGGFTIIYLADKRQVLTADPRDARLSIKQLTIRFPAGISQADATARAAAFATGLKQLQGCGTAERVGAAIGAEVVDNDSVPLRSLPAQLQEIMLRLQIGQATPPFGTPSEGVRAFVLCGRDDSRGNAGLPRADQVQNQLEETRVNLRAQQKLRDLRRDAVIDYR